MSDGEATFSENHFEIKRKSKEKNLNVKQNIVKQGKQKIKIEKTQHVDMRKYQTHFNLYYPGIDENFKLNILDHITNSIKNSLRQSKKTDSYRDLTNDKKNQNQQIVSRQQIVKSQRVSEISATVSDKEQSLTNNSLTDQEGQMTIQNNANNTMVELMSSHSHSDIDNPKIAKDDEGKIGVLQPQLLENPQSKHKKHLSKKMMKIQPLFNEASEASLAQDMATAKKAKNKMGHLNMNNQFLFEPTNISKQMPYAKNNPRHQSIQIEGVMDYSNPGP